MGQISHYVHDNSEQICHKLCIISHLSREMYIAQLSHQMCVGRKEPYFMHRTSRSWKVHKLATTWWWKCVRTYHAVPVSWSETLIWRKQWKTECAQLFFRFRELCLEKVTSNMARGLRFLLIWNFALGEKISPDIMLCGWLGSSCGKKMETWQVLYLLRKLLFFIF